MGSTLHQIDRDEQIPGFWWGASRIATERSPRQRGWSLFMALVWICYLGYPLAALVRSHPSPVRLALGLTGGAFVVAVYAWMVLRLYFKRRPAVERWTAVLGLLTLAVVMSIGYGAVWFPTFIYAEAAVAALVPGRRGLLTAIAVLGVMALTGRQTGIGPGAVGSWVFQTALITLVMGGFVRLVETIIALREAREELARLAVAEERLRFARDLHDLLGHSLSLIVLKTELAGRLLPAAPERAASEVRDVERVAREALREVREAVAGYRQPTLAGELASARDMLSAAGIACTVAGEEAVLPAPADSVLAWALREGVTNVIRHSRAERCRLAVGRDADSASLEVVDDGVGEAGRTEGSGSGLAGIAERVAARGGRLEAGPRAEGGFRLWVSVPAYGDREDSGP